jgi:hypothetical protein
MCFVHRKLLANVDSGGPDRTTFSMAHGQNGLVGIEAILAPHRETEVNLVHLGNPG